MQGIDQVLWPGAVPSLVPCLQVTLIREYCQGVNEMAYVLPTGAFDPQRHRNPQGAARAELSEEVRPLAQDPVDITCATQSRSFSAARVQSWAVAQPKSSEGRTFSETDCA